MQQLAAATNTLPGPDMEECGICYLDYDSRRRPRPLATCRHVVCSSCLEQLAAGGSGAVTCPFCRASSPSPSDEEEGGGAGDVTGKGPLKWLKRLCRKRAGSRREGSLAKEDIRDLALMSSYFM